MAEIYIPEKLKSIVDFEPIVDSSGKKTAKGRYDLKNDRVILDPDVATISTFCEELYHRKQDQFLVSSGLYKEFTHEQDLFYACGEEIGIIPTIHQIEKRHNLLELKGEVTSTYIRYFQEAGKFANHLKALDPEVTSRFLSIVRGNRLFDGIQAVLDYIKEGYNPWTFYFVSDFSDVQVEAKAWEKINAARKNWR